MFSSLLEAARSSPFHGPLTPARCDAIAAPTQAMAANATEVGDSCEFGSTKYFALCGLGGILSCGKYSISSGSGGTPAGNVRPADRSRPDSTSTALAPRC